MRVTARTVAEAFICFQGGTDSSILGVALSEEQAQNICNEFGDRYFSVEIGKRTSREATSSDDIATYNIDAVFIKGYDNAVKKIEGS